MAIAFGKRRFVSKNPKLFATSPSAKAAAVNAFINHVNAQSGKAFTGSQATLLVRLAGSL